MDNSHSGGDERGSARKVVRSGYDRLAERYQRWSERIEGDPRDRFVRDFADRLPVGARVLDLGCGPGTPSTAQLADRFDVVGVDISMTQLRIASSSVHHAAFVCGDITEIAFRPASFHGVVALYSLIHVPRESHPAVLRRISRWLRPGGWALLVLGAGDSPGSVEEDWIGVEMFFSSYGTDVNRRMVQDAGFVPLIDEVVSIREPGGAASFLWLLGSKEETPT